VLRNECVRGIQTYAGFSFFAPLSALSRLSFRLFSSLSTRLRLLLSPFLAFARPLHPLLHTDTFLLGSFSSLPSSYRRRDRGHPSPRERRSHRRQSHLRELLTRTSLVQLPSRSRPEPVRSRLQYRGKLLGMRRVDRVRRSRHGDRRRPRRQHPHRAFLSFPPPASCFL
jgi:hypothetical protein